MSEAESEKLASFRRYQLRWLAQAGLLGRPWFVFASAPNPTLPTYLPENCAHIYLNFSGQSAKALNLPDADLLLVKRKRRHEQLRGLRPGRVIQLSRFQSNVDRHRILQAICRYRLATMRISQTERTQMARAVVGDIFSGVGEDGNPSNGIALVLYGIWMGIPQMILSGFSLTSDGHSHTQSIKFRMHKEEDTACFNFVAAHFRNVSTTEVGLHNLTGMPLWDGGTIAVK